MLRLGSMLKRPMRLRVTGDTGLTIVSAKERTMAPSSITSSAPACKRSLTKVMTKPLYAATCGSCGRRIPHGQPCATCASPRFLRLTHQWSIRALVLVAMCLAHRLG